jgi:adenylate cyclase
LAVRILIIDDDREFVDGVRVGLETEGFEIITANDGETGFARAVGEHPDLIVLDVMMKTVTEGVHVARQLSRDERTCGIPVLMLSSIKETLKLAEDLAPDPVCLPVVKFLEKPVVMDELITQIRAAMKEKGTV